MKAALTLPPSLNSVAAAWREFFRTIPFTMEKNLDAHIKGFHSVYVQEIILRRKCGDRTLYYVGQSASPARRAAAHKSELKCCKATTFVGKSILYSSEYMKGLVGIDMRLVVYAGGMTAEEAKIYEKIIAEELKEQHGADVLTRPSGVIL